MKFKMLDTLIDQKAQLQSGFDAMAERERQAKENYHAKKAEYESTITESVLSGADVTKDLDKLAKEIEEAKTAYERRVHERNIYSAARPAEKISSDDVVNAWNNEYVPEFNKKKRDPALNKLISVKRAYAEALLEYKGIIREFDNEKYVVANELGDSYRYQLKDVSFNFTREREKFTLGAHDLRSLESGKVPDYWNHHEELNGVGK
ncbi:hypothetical protein ABES25_04710 [Bacillus gobiensis]|uniref:hypothetical protein n=1 Tax=Bacillus gobiensis TaxID=1441095 RepID=UPI003D261B8E